jgi:hypothetical protein
MILIRHGLPQASINGEHPIQLQLPDTTKPRTEKAEETPECDNTGKRVFGQFPGKVHWAGDFNAELPDAVWLGKDA